MFHKAKDLIGYKLGAKDGEIGRVKDFYFEDIPIGASPIGRTGATLRKRYFSIARPYQADEPWANGTVIVVRGAHPSAMRKEAGRVL